MNRANIIIPFIGGLGMFIYGMQIMAEGLENTAGGKMKSLLEVLTKNRFMGVLFGAFVTAVIQSSSATTVMVVGFVNAGLMNLTQAMSVIMGANVGTTVTGWLVSSVEWAKFLSPVMLAPVAIMVGVIIMLVGKRRKSKEISTIIIGFGLLFVGITTMSAAVAPLRDVPAFREAFIKLGANPALGILAGAVVTAIIQSSSASVGILQSLAAAGLVPFGAAVYIIMGQNIGTCVTALLSSVGAKKNAKTAALMHLVFNLIGTIIFLVGAVLYFEVFHTHAGDGLITQTQISLVHTVFNIGTTVLLFPAANVVVRLAKKIAHFEETGAGEEELLLDDRMLETPTVALIRAKSETVRMGEIAVRGLMSAEKNLLNPDASLREEVIEDESMIDKMTEGLTEFIIRLSMKHMTDEEQRESVRMLQIITDIERISDYAENLSEFSDTLQENKVTFSEKGRKEMQEMGEACCLCYKKALESYKNDNLALAHEAIDLEEKADEYEISMRQGHIERLAKNKCSTASGVVYLDALVAFERISDHARNIAEEVV